MAQIMNFNAAEIDVTPRFEVLPAGEYNVIITQSDNKQTKDGSGTYLELRLEIQSGQYQGRLLFDRLNLQNRNQQAVEIAQRQLAQICHAVGVLQLQDSEQLHNLPLVAIVKIRPASGNYDASNEIKGYKAASGAIGQAAAPARVVQAAAQTAQAVAPWAKRAA